MKMHKDMKPLKDVVDKVKKDYPFLSFHTMIRAVKDKKNKIPHGRSCKGKGRIFVAEKDIRKYAEQLIVND